MKKAATQPEKKPAKIKEVKEKKPRVKKPPVKEKKPVLNKKRFHKYNYYFKNKSV
jgi:hypothetical protein